MSGMAEGSCMNGQGSCGGNLIVNDRAGRWLAGVLKCDLIAV